MASAACFPAFQPHVIAEKQYVDGGFFDNVPINLAIEMGAEEIIAVLLQDINLVRPVRTKGIKIIRIGRKKRSTLGPLLVFDPSQTIKNMNWGYQDCMKTFGRLEWAIYSFSKGFLKGECKRLKREYARLFHSCVKSYPTALTTLPQWLTSTGRWEGISARKVFPAWSGPFYVRRNARRNIGA